MLKVPWSTIVFQSTRPRGRTRLQSFCGGFLILCFNPRVLAGGRDCACGFDLPAGFVSIHASSREDATIILRRVSRGRSFNPRVLAGGRDLPRRFCLFACPVSIHASSREDAT